jgi:hypothetical protein
MTMTLEEEEKVLRDKLRSARHAIEAAAQNKRAAQMACNRAEKELADIEQACLDYMNGNGLVETENFVVSVSHRVDVESVDGVPDAYIRTKTTKEPDKIKIKADRPNGNWYVITEHQNIKTIGE